MYRRSSVQKESKRIGVNPVSTLSNVKIKISKSSADLKSVVHFQEKHDQSAESQNKKSTPECNQVKKVVCEGNPNKKLVPEGNQQKKLDPAEGNQLKNPIHEPRRSAHHRKKPNEPVKPVESVKSRLAQSKDCIKSSTLTGRKGKQRVKRSASLDDEDLVIVKDRPRTVLQTANRLAIYLRIVI